MGFISVAVAGSLYFIGIEVACSYGECWSLILARCEELVSSDVCKECAVAGLWHIVVRVGVLEMGLEGVLRG